MGVMFSWGVSFLCKDTAEGGPSGPHPCRGFALDKTLQGAKPGGLEFHRQVKVFAQGGAGFTYDAANAEDMYRLMLSLS